MRLLRSVVLTASIISTACQSTYSPPLRMSSFGAPANVRRGEVEAGFAGGVMGPDEEPLVRMMFSPLLAVGVTDWLAIEGAGEASVNRAVSGHGALRFNLDGRERGSRRLDADLAIGGGGGAGGIVCDNRDWEGVAQGLGTLAEDVECPGDKIWDGRQWHERRFGGGLAEIGLGFPLRNYRFVPFVRVRTQLTSGTGTPTTFWGALQGGLHFNMKENSRFHIGIGASIYHNAVDGLRGHLDNHLDFFAELGFSVGIPLTYGAVGEGKTNRGEPGSKNEPGEPGVGMGTPAP